MSSPTSPRRGDLSQSRISNVILQEDNEKDEEQKGGGVETLFSEQIQKQNMVNRLKKGQAYFTRVKNKNRLDFSRHNVHWPEDAEEVDEDTHALLKSPMT